jgi:hypothetical protein
MGSRKRLLMLLMVAFWVANLNRVVQASHLCEDVCGATSCDSECWLTQFDYDNEYPSTTCGEQSYSCCGDEVCDTGAEYCGTCIGDCLESPTCGTDCTYNFQCGSGEVCNSSHQCVIPSPHVGGGGTTCSVKHDCQGNDVCVETDCAIPHLDYCPNSQDCQYTACPSGQYCDPGIVRCQYVDSPGCPPS